MRDGRVVQQDIRTTKAAVYKSHRGERSRDLNRLPTASCRQCQTSARAFGGLTPALLLDSRLLGCRRGGTTGTSLALASCQCGLAISPTAARSVEGVSTGLVFGIGTMISGSARMAGSSSLSDFADSLSAKAVAVVLRSEAGSTIKAAGAATLTASAAPSPTRQKTASHIILVMLISQAVTRGGG
jgi:hypothetical protein